jgi:trehalose 6-phosphate phosphatase
LQVTQEKKLSANIDELSEFWKQLSVAPASVLLLDYDGTLAPFQMERHRAYPYPKVIPLLKNIVRGGKTRVAVITGRPIVELKVLLRPFNNIEVWGAHGLERMLPDGSYRQIAIDSEAAEGLRLAKERMIEAGLAPLAEIKPGGIAIHWRGMPADERERVEGRLRESWAEMGDRPGLKLLKFEGGLELRVAHPDKGDAVSAIIAESDPSTPIAFLGDDITDEDSFRVLRDRGLTVLVRSEYRETSAKVWLKPPQELIEFLEQWLTQTSA